MERIETARRSLGQLQHRLLVLLVTGAAVSGLTFSAPPAASAAAGSSELFAGETLLPGQYLVNGNARLIMQKDGNLVLYNHYGNVGGTQKVCGKSNTTAYPGAHAYMSPGGNKSFSVYDTHGTVRWTTSPHTDGWGYAVYVSGQSGSAEVVDIGNTRSFVFWPC